MTNFIMMWDDMYYGTASFHLGMQQAQKGKSSFHWVITSSIKCLFQSMIGCSHHLGWTLRVNILYYIHQVKYCLGILCQGTFFSSTLLLLTFLICTYLSYSRFKFNVFLLSFDIWYLFKILSLVFEVRVVRNDEDIATKDDRITW
jgi:hypothetical protein